MKLLKKDVNAQSANTALNEFRRIVGDEWVFSSDEDVALYRDMPRHTFGTGDRKKWLTSN